MVYFTEEKNVLDGTMIVTLFSTLGSFKLQRCETLIEYGIYNQRSERHSS